MTSNDVEPCLTKSGPGPCPSGLNTIDDVTLAYMVNTTQYEKYLKKNHMDYDSIFKRDIRFYRKRIISLTKDLFKEQVENDKNKNVLAGAFNMYMRACISYLKFSDQSESIQKCYVCLGINDDDDNQNQKCICKNKNENELFELNKANELCLKPKEVKKITLDNYVIRKNVKKSEPIVYPQQFTFNPRDPAFKCKGLKPKPQSRSQSVEKIRIETKIDDINENVDKPKELTKQSVETLKRVTSIENGENREKNIKDSNEKTNEKTNEKIKNNKKKKKNKKVSFDVTNYIDNI
jgi:hypothetical protein